MQFTPSDVSYNPELLQNITVWLRFYIQLHICTVILIRHAQCSKLTEYSYSQYERQTVGLALARSTLHMCTVSSSVEYGGWGWGKYLQAPILLPTNEMSWTNTLYTPVLHSKHPNFSKNSAANTVSSALEQRERCATA